MSKPRYQARVPQDMAERLEDMRHDDQGNELMSKSEVTKRLLTDGLNAGRPLMTLNQAFVIVFLSVALNALLNGQAGIVIVSVAFAGGMLALDAAWVAAAGRYGIVGPREAYDRARRVLSPRGGRE